MNKIMPIIGYIAFQSALVGNYSSSDYIIELPHTLFWATTYLNI